MTDVPSGRGLIHTPTIKQPVQTARLGAQQDGGIEWNWSPGMIGHWVGTQRDVFAAKLNTSLGPVLRVYEFDRWNETFFQVDMLVLNGTLFAHPKVFNPNAGELSGYWWTCSGLEFTTPGDANNCKSSLGNPGSRLLSPATYEVDNTLQPKPWPWHDLTDPSTNKSVDLDLSWLLNSNGRGNDHFLRVVDGSRPHLTVIDKDLYGQAVGLHHAHELNGSKFWSGGGGGNSQRWYDWKDAPPSPSGRGYPANNGGGSGTNSFNSGTRGCFFEPQVGFGPVNQITKDNIAPSFSKWL